MVKLEFKCRSQPTSVSHEVDRLRKHHTQLFTLSSAWHLEGIANELGKNGVSCYSEYSEAPCFSNWEGCSLQIPISEDDVHFQVRSAFPVKLPSPHIPKVVWGESNRPQENRKLLSKPKRFVDI